MHIFILINSPDWIRTNTHTVNSRKLYPLSYKRNIIITYYNISIFFNTVKYTNPFFKAYKV
jgi:hypothetical protein